MLAAILCASVIAAVPPPGPPEVWQFKREFLPYLVAQVPGILKSQDPATGRFGSGVWIVTDQNVLLPLAAAWAIDDPANPYHHSAKLLDAIMAGGDALIAAQDARGTFEFRKKDNSTWGRIYMPWTYSRWVRAYGLVKDAMPPERRAKWEKALTLAFEGVAKGELAKVHNIPTHHAMGLYAAGLAMDRPEWRRQAAEFMKRAASAQDAGGFWSENYGPVVNYNFVYVDAIGTYYAMSGDKTVLPALERAARFHAAFTYPDGSCVETVDERNPYHGGRTMPNVGFSFTPEGRGYVRSQWERIKAAKGTLGADMAASFLLYGQEGDVTPTPAEQKSFRFVLGHDDAAVQRSGPWFACLSAYRCAVPRSRWIQDRQNFLSLFRDGVGLIVGGGNTKLQPLWSTFTVGDTSLLAHRPGDENPSFLPPPGLLHVPTASRLDPDRLSLDLDYGPAKCRVSVDVSRPEEARLTYELLSGSGGPVAAHVTLLPHIGGRWETASGRSGVLGSEAVRLTGEETGGWFAHNGWRVSVPSGASVVWPALPHNPYRKDGSAEPAEGRIVLVLPMAGDRTRYEVTVQPSR